MSPGFKMAYKEKYKTYPNEAVAPEDMTYKLPIFIPTQNLPGVTMVSAKLPGVTITAPDLSKPQQLEGITVEANNGSSFAYGNGANPLAEVVNRNKAKRQLTSNRGLLYQEGGAFQRTKRGN